MKPELKAAWIAALRSKNYQQGDGFLKNKENGCFCCLGVLCEAAGLSWISLSDDERGEFPTKDDRIGKETGLLGIFRAELGLTEGQEDTLVNMNDGLAGEKRRTFSEIADWIEYWVRAKE